MNDISAPTPELLGLVLSEEGCGHTNTVLLLQSPGQLQSRVVKAATGAGLGVCFADSPMDLVSVPACLVVVDPTLVDANEWEAICDYYSESGDSETQFLLTAQSPHDSELPPANLVQAVLQDSEEHVQHLILRCRAAFTPIEVPPHDDEEGCEAVALRFLKRTTRCVSVQRWVESPSSADDRQPTGRAG